MYAFYTVRGFKLEYLSSLPMEEQLFYIESMALYYENINSMFETKQDSPKQNKER